MKKPVTELSNSKPWKVYIVSIFLQSWAWVLCKFTGRKITHGFYYSESQDRVIRELEKVTASYPNRTQFKRTFRGCEYTEMLPIEYGWPNWKDSEFLGLGSIADAQIKPINHDWDRNFLYKMEELG